MSAFPIHLELAGRRVVVVGAGAVGRRRAAALLAADARVRWVAPDVASVPADPSLARAEPVAAAFTPAHLEGALLCFACAPPAVNAEVLAAARARGVLCGRSDAGGGGDFVVPGRIQMGDLVLDISTGGVAPAATVALRRELSALVPATWGRFVALMAEARARLEGEPDREARLGRLASGPLLAKLSADGEAAARAWLDAELSGLPSGRR